MDEALFPIKINFRGERAYLHSASIFDALVAQTGAATNIKLTFRRVLTRPLAAFPPNPKLPAHFEADGVKLSIAEVDGPEPGREPYDESARLAGSSITGHTIHSPAGPGTFSERVVALNKRLIEDVSGPKGKVIFVSMALSRLPDDGADLSVTLEGSAGGFHQSTLRSAGEIIGSTVFATLKPKGFVPA